MSEPALTRPIGALDGRSLAVGHINEPAGLGERPMIWGHWGNHGGVVLDITRQCQSLR